MSAWVLYWSDVFGAAEVVDVYAEMTAALTAVAELDRSLKLGEVFDLTAPKQMKMGGCNCVVWEGEERTLVLVEKVIKS